MAENVRFAIPADVPAIEQLLRDNALPVGGVDERLGTTLLALDNGDVTGTAALEVFDDGALLRSVAVHSACRSAGTAARLVEALLALASERDVPAVYLLTTTAERYFPRFGFQRIGRDEVPAGVRHSDEFTSACPASATVMKKAL